MKNWKKYGFEFLSIFVAVAAAFALNNWNDNRRDRLAENKILAEIYNGLEQDLIDIGTNIGGHQSGIEAAKFWMNYLEGNQPPTDSLYIHYLSLTRDFICIQNVSGYENLKSRGLELIRDDSLRSKIISLYEYDFNTLRKVEEEYEELQFFANYFPDFNRLIAPVIIYDENGNPIGLAESGQIGEADRRLLDSLLWRIIVNRNFITSYYREVVDEVEEVRAEIERSLEMK